MKSLVSPVITIDGPSASGKGTLARKLSGRLGFDLLNVGKLYRQAAYQVLKSGGDFANIESIIDATQRMTKDARSMVSDQELGSECIGQAAGQVAATKEAVEIIEAYCKALCSSSRLSKRGIVVDARHGGTSIAPHAQVKLWLNAALETRATRRYNELIKHGARVSYQDVFHSIKQRDIKDATNTLAPLRCPKDAIKVLTTRLNPEQVYLRSLGIISASLPISMLSL